LNQYEAENAVLHHVQLEALYGSFTGWGYIAGWNADDQWIEFGINSATAGAHTLMLRYAAGAGDAARVIRVNGTVLAPALKFPATSGWASYNTVSLPCNLPAGHSTVSIQYDSTRNSANWLNLDNLVVTGDPPPQIRILETSLTNSGGVHVTWSATPGQIYRVQYNSGLTNGSWIDLGIPITASNVIASAEDRSATNHTRFYRIVTP
jgi:hypothetical protein